MFTRSVLSVCVVAAMTTACSSTAQRTVAAPASPAEVGIYCRGVPEQSAADLLSQPGLVEAVYEDHVQEQWGHNTVSHLKGAKIMVRPEPGVSRPMLARALQCRVANSLPPSLAINDTDPLTTGHVDVRVSETDTGYMVTIRSQNENEAREIVRRANNLLAHSVARAPAMAELAKDSIR